MIKNKKFFAGLTVMALMILTLSGISMASNTGEKITDLALWKGDSESFINLYNTESADEFFAEVAKYKEGYNGKMVRKFFEKMYETPFSKMNVKDSNTIIFDNEIEADYNFVGELHTVWGEYSIVWYIFRTDSKEAIQAGYKNLILMPYHGHGDGMKHCHMRYGNENFDF